MSLQIAIDASRTTVPRVTGTERYAIQLIRALIKLNREHRITLYFRNAPARGLLPDSPLVTYRVIPLRRVWTHARFAAALWKDRPDVTFVPAHTLPVAFPGRAVVTTHDLGYKYFPQAHPLTDRLYLDWSTRYSVGRAQVVLADSQATADDLTRHYDTPPDHVRVVYPGVIAPRIGNLDAMRTKYGLPKNYFIFLSTLHPRKNIARLVKAYMRYREAVYNPAALVLAGGQGWLFDPAWVAGAEGVYLLGYIDEADKGALYAGATALVFPSLYEGFGFPVLEAMHSGTPVIASNTSSLPELVGEAGILINPKDVDAIAEAMTRLATNSDLQARYIALGREQAKQFTWAATAAAALAGIEDAAVKSI